jgi:hypothetical protein
MPTQIQEQAITQPRGFFGLLSTIRWEVQFKLAKCCMRASIAISDLGVLLAEPVLERQRKFERCAVAFQDVRKTG